MINEHQLEQLALSWFQDTGWQYAYGPDIAPGGDAQERADFHEVVLKNRLAAAIARLNPSFPKVAVDEVVQLVTKPQHPGLLPNNHAFHRQLLEGVKLDFTNKQGERDINHAQLVDFHHPGSNDFLIVNQLTVGGSKQARRPDVVVYVNGLPLSVIELKNPAGERADIWDAYHQLQTYKEEISDLFVFNQALVISDGTNARVGSLTAGREWFLPWRTIKDEDDKPFLEFELEKIVRGFFDPALFLEYIRYFVIFERDGDEWIKKIAGYHQFHGVREAVRVTLIASQQEPEGVLRERRASYGQKVVPGSKKAGVFWHTQGSGKSISMACYAGMLLQQPEMNNPTLVVVTDRNELDGQLYQQFSSARDLLKQAPEQAENRDELRSKLASRQAGGIIFTTIQKFSLRDKEIDHPVLCDRANVVVISDEAHRSQYGLKGRLNKDSGQYAYGFAKYMRDALPNASFIGFTGTPIALDDKNTINIFGEYVSIYDIQDAVDDGATVSIYYESRLAKLDVNREEIDKLNKDVEEVIEDEEDVTSREKTKMHWAELSKLVGAQPRLAEVAADLVQHFEGRNESLLMGGKAEGKAMIVCMSRDICVGLFNELIALRPDWEGSLREKIRLKPKQANGGNKDEAAEAAGETSEQEAGKENREKEIVNSYSPEDGAVRIVMTGTASDRPELQRHMFSRAEKKRLERRFKDPNDPLKLVIVRDMWLTGFDAPVCHTLYVDKPMKGHNLAQAVARVNRVFKGKPGGLVVDYLGIAAELKRAVKTYTDAKGKGEATIKVEEALLKLKEKLGVVRDMFHGFDYSAYETEALPLLPGAANHILGLENGKQRFNDVMAAVSKAYALCATLDEAADLRKEIAFFNAVRSAIIKDATTRTKPSRINRNRVLKQILDNAVVSDGVLDVFQMAGVDKPDIALLSEEFLEDVRHMPHKNLAVELLERLLRDEIRGRLRTNVVQEKKYSERLLAALRRYHNRAVETSMVIEELIGMAKEFQASVKRHEDLGLNPDEIAFYDALAERPEVLKDMGDESLKKLAVELTEKLRASTTVDWQVRESVRAKMRLLVKRLLRKYKYPPEGQKEAVQRVIEQAEALADLWSGGTAAQGGSL